MSYSIPRIKELPSSTSALIAAGEVIHGPRDVLKELLENALDAGATKITVELSQGGIAKIFVRDNGCGIVADDLQHAPKRYTTSKLEHVDELRNLMTYGFRGEALFSISSVSNFTLRSRPKAQEYGYQIKLWNPLRQWEESKCAMEPGTEVLCEHLFAPLPVRRQFLKSARLEARRCLQTVINILLMHPYCRIFCSDQGMTQLNWPSAESLLQRFTKAFNTPDINWTVIEHPCDRGLIKIWYYPDSTKSLEQFWYCHRRWFADKNLSRLAQQFFEEGILIIDLEIHRASIDVNFHPQKHEIDFIRKEGLIASLTDIFHTIKPKKDILLKDTLSSALMASDIVSLVEPLRISSYQKRDNMSADTSEEYDKDKSIARNQPQNFSVGGRGRDIFTQPVVKPVTAENKKPLSWFFISKTRAFYDSGFGVIYFNPEKLGSYLCSQQGLQDLILPINVPPDLADYLKAWHCRCQNNQIEAIPRLWDRFWIIAIVADFKATAVWYRRFYQGLMSQVWEKLSDKSELEIALSKSQSLIKFMSYEEFSERLDG